MLRILVVDDSKAVHAFLKSCLSKFQVNLTHVYNGQEAIDEISKNSAPFDLILLDWEMPVLDGPSTFDKIQSLPQRAPTLMMTTKNSFDDVSVMVKKGVSEYMFKPFTPDILLEKLALTLGRPIS
jgi:two-component system chemotaxis response regulator CheY